MTVFLSAVLAVLSAQTASADQRPNKTYTTVNGRTAVSSPGSSPAAAPSRIIAINKPGGGTAANSEMANSPMAGQAPEVPAGLISGAPVDGGRSFMGGGRPVASRGATGRAVHRGGKAFKTGGRAAAGGGAPAPTETEEAPPNYSKPGALIRTTGQQPVYEKVESRTNTVDAGEIVMNNRKAVDVGRAPSVQQGPKDTPPPPNPGGGGSGYGGGASANSGPRTTVVKDNNGSGNNDKGTPGDDYDDKGKKNSLEDDPTGFNSAF